MTLFLIAVAGLIAGLGMWRLYLTARGLVRLHRSGDSLFPVRTEECHVCGTLLPIDVAHIIADVEDDPETGGGTAVIATFCAKDCPGGCQRGCCPHELFDITEETMVVAEGKSWPLFVFRCVACDQVLPSTPERVAAAKAHR